MTQVINNVTKYVLEIVEGAPVSVISSIALADLTDVQGGATSGQVIQYNGTQWVPTTLAATSTVEYLEDLLNVAAGATTGQVIQYNGTNWVPTTLTAASGVLQNDIDVTDGAGAVEPGDTLTAGTSLEDVFNSIFVSYQAPVMTLSSWTTGTYEHGATYPSDTNFTLAFTNDSNIDTGVSGTWSITDTYITDDSGTAAPADGSTTIPAYTGTLLVSNTNAGVSTTHRSQAAKLTVSGFQDTNGDAIGSKNKSSFVRFRYWVLDSATTINQNPASATVQSMLASADSSLDGSGAGVIESGLISDVSDLGLTTSGSYGFVYWLLPQAFPVSSITQNTSINLYAGDTADQTTAVIYLGEVDIDNQHGQTVKMQLLRSKVSNAFASGSVIAFS